jgi:hypothetical protein
MNKLKIQNADSGFDERFKKYFSADNPAETAVTLLTEDEYQKQRELA